MKVVVLHDLLLPAAREDQFDTLVQAEAVSRAMRELGHDVNALAFKPDLAAVAADLQRLRPDLVFNLVESVDGHSRLLHIAPALLDTRRIPYTGGSTESLFITTHKLLTKRLLKGNGLPTPPWWHVHDNVVGDEVRWPARFIIKGVCEEASVGIGDDSIVEIRNQAGLATETCTRAERLGGDAFAELYIDGREFNLSLLGGESDPLVLPPAEIHFEGYPATKPKIVNYAAKWIENSYEYHHTPRCFDFAAADQPLLEQLSDLARACWKLFQLRGYARVDFRVDRDNRAWILEINVNPCISPDAGFVAAAERAGLSYRQLIERILACTGGLPGNSA